MPSNITAPFYTLETHCDLWPAPIPTVSPDMRVMLDNLCHKLLFFIGKQHLCFAFRLQLANKTVGSRIFSILIGLLVIVLCNFRFAALLSLNSMLLCYLGGECLNVHVVSLYANALFKNSNITSFLFFSSEYLTFTYLSLYWYGSCTLYSLLIQCLFRC